VLSAKEECGVTNQETQVRVAILRHALHAQPISTASLSVATGLTPAKVDAALAALHEAGAIYLANGGAAAAYPVSFRPTKHRVTIDGVTTYANCAVDALAVPPMVEAAVEVASECAHCGATITVMMLGDRVLGARPAAPVVFYPSADCCEGGPAVLTRCPHINFFCDRDHAVRWQAAHPARQGTVLVLSKAAAFAREHFATVICAVRRA